MKVKIVCALVSLNLMWSTAYAGNDLQFNPAFLNVEGFNIADLSWVNAGGELPPGEYNINIYVNNDYVFTGNIKFDVDKESTDSAVAPCLTLEQITAMGIDVKQAQNGILVLTKQCYYLKNAFPGTDIDFVQKTLTANISVPQHFMLNLPRGYVKPGKLGIRN